MQRVVGLAMVMAMALGTVACGDVGDVGGGTQGGANTNDRSSGGDEGEKLLTGAMTISPNGKYIIAAMQNFGPRVWERLIKWMDEKGVTGELHDPKYQDEAFRTSEYRTGTVVRNAVGRLIAASNGEECLHRAQSYGISWGLVHAVEERVR